MPRRCAVRATRTAISPRFAMRILSNIEFSEARRHADHAEHPSIDYEDSWAFFRSAELRGSLLCFHPRRRPLLQKSIGPFLPFGSHANVRDARSRVLGKRLVDRP